MSHTKISDKILQFLHDKSQHTKKHIPGVEILNAIRITESELKNTLQQLEDDNYVNVIRPSGYLPMATITTEGRRFLTESAQASRINPPNSSNNSKRWKIFLAGADPGRHSSDARILDSLQTEFDYIQDLKLRSPYKEKFDLANYPSLTFNEFISILREFGPQIIHFSGHGDADGSLTFNDGHGNIDKIAANDLSKLFSIENTRTKIHCIILNACYSEVLASELIKYVDYVIGVSGKVIDKHAMQFAVKFYEGLGNDYGIEQAFSLAELDMKFIVRSIRSPFIIKKRNGV